MYVNQTNEHIFKKHNSFCEILDLVFLLYASYELFTRKPIQINLKLVD